MNKKFRESVVFGNIGAVESALAESPEIVHERDEYGFTALHEAVGEDCREMIELLVRSGADVNAKNDEGITPLHLACYPFAVDILLKGGADSELRSNEGLTPLHIHVEHRERIDVIEALADGGANVNALTPADESPCAIAMDLGHYEIVDVLKRYEGR